MFSPITKSVPSSTGIVVVESLTAEASSDVLSVSGVVSNLNLMPCKAIMYPYKISYAVIDNLPSVLDVEVTIKYNLSKELDGFDKPFDANPKGD